MCHRGDGVRFADSGGRTAAQVLFGQVSDVHHRLEPVRADGGCTGSLVERCLATLDAGPGSPSNGGPVHLPAVSRVLESQAR